MRTTLKRVIKLALALFALVAFSGVANACQYVVGDVNGSGAFNGLDVVWAINYYEGEPPPPYSCECPPGSGRYWYVAGDVNSTCNFNGLDVTYMVGYFKGGPAPIPCADCPPAGLLAPPIHGFEPIKAPVLKPRGQTETSD